MKRYLSLAFLLLAAVSVAFPQIASLDKLDSSKPYLIKNVNGYGYCIYNPDISSYYATIGGATVEHPSGCVNELYKSAIDKTNTNNQWMITPVGDGSYYVKNVGLGKYLTDHTKTNYGWYFDQEYWYDFYFTETATAFEITEQSSGVFSFRLSDVQSDSYGDTDHKYMCAASQNTNAITIWTSDDLGSQWQIVSVDGTDPVTPDTPDEPDTPDTPDDPEEEMEEDLGTITYINLSNGEMVAIPQKYIVSITEDASHKVFHLVGDSTYTYMKQDLISEDTTYYGAKPEFESFKFNNKFNDQLYGDAEGVIDSTSHKINIDVCCIGKRLTPSFKVPDGASAWVNGKLQHSKVTRRRFDDDVTYTVAYPKNWIYRSKKLSDDVWEVHGPTDTESEWIVTPVTLTSSMLSTNAPSNRGEDPANMLDGDTGTFFHSTWGSGTYTPLAWSEGATYGDGTSEWPYLQIDLPEPLYTLKFSYTTRGDRTNYAPLGFILQGSNDGVNWEDTYNFTQMQDNLPTGAGVTYNSPIVSLGQDYKHLRWQLTASSHKNYLVISEFSLDKVTANPDYGSEEGVDSVLIKPAEYSRSFVPFGTDYTVHVNYLTDHSTTAYKVPRIDILFGDSTTWSSSMWIGRNGKTYYEDASIKIDGGGVFPDLPKTYVQIKGRGNTSWSSSSSSKNPYRLKFSEKQKPLGLKKGKSWVLLANKQTGSMTTNAIAMRLADMVETNGCNHIIPVELYINNQYRGSYNFTEKVGFSNNSVDLDDESQAAMLELDSYYDGDYKWKDPALSLPINLSFPDFSDESDLAKTTLTFTDIQNKFNLLTKSIKFDDLDYENMIDIESFAKAWLVTDLTRNQELKHPKSWYLYNADIKDSLWSFGPLWDFDWAFGYDGTSTYFVNAAESDLFSYMSTENAGYNFFSVLAKNSDKILKEYYRQWVHFMRDDRLSEIKEYCDDLYEFASASFVHNASKWSDGKAYDTQTTKAKNWLQKRANYIFANLKQFDLDEDSDTGDEDYGDPSKPTISGDVNGDGSVDVADINAVLTTIFGSAEYSAKADVNVDKIIDIADVNAVLTIMFNE